VICPKSSSTTFSAYKKSLNAAINTATKAPVVISDERAATLDDVAAAVAEVAEPEPELEWEVELDAVLWAPADEDAALAARASAVAFREPHCSLFWHWVWPSKSLGWLAMH
jgi:hypothetical protein